MKHFKIFLIAVIALIVIAACAPAPAAPQIVKETVVVRETARPAAVVPAATPGGRSVNIAAQFDLTFLYAPVVRNAFRAVNDYVAEVNSKGGIDGVRVNLLWADHALNIARAQAVYKRFVDEKPKPLCLQTAWSSENEVLKDSFAKDQIPVLGSGLSPKSVVPPGWIFLILPDYASQFGFFLDYVNTNWKDTTRRPVISFITWNTAYGIGMLTDESKAYAKKLNIELKEPTFISLIPPPTDTSPQLQTVAAQKPDYVWTNTLPEQFTQVLKDHKRLGLNLQFAGVTWMSLDEIWGNAGELADGFIVVRTFATGDETDLPGVKAIQAAQIKYHGAYDRNSFTTYALGWLGTQMCVDAIASAIKKVGLEKVTGDIVYNELVTLKEYSTGGVTRNISFSANERRGTLEARIVKGVWDKTKTPAIGTWQVLTPWGKVPDMLPK